MISDEELAALGLRRRVGDIHVGDLYVARRNRGIRLLTVKEIRDSYVVPCEGGEYYYDVWECLPVEGY